MLAKTFLSLVNISLLFLLQSCIEAPQKEPVTPESLTGKFTKEVRKQLYLVTEGKSSELFGPFLDVRRGLLSSIDALVYVGDCRTASIHDSLVRHEKLYMLILTRLNSMRNFRPFLAEFPLTPDILRVSVVFVPGIKKDPFLSDFTNSPPPNISSIIVSAESLEVKQHYQSKGKGERSYIDTVLKRLLKDVGEFSSLYAVGVRREKNNGDPLVLPVTKPRELPMWQKIPYKYIPSFCEKNDLKLIVAGVMDEHVDDYDYGFALMGDQKIHLDEARSLGGRCAKQFLFRMQNDEEAREYTCKENHGVHRPDPDSPPGPRNFAFRISFWDENIDRVEAPYIAEVRFQNSVFKYFTADEGQRLVLAHEETFDEAMKFLEERCPASSQE